MLQLLYDVMQMFALYPAKAHKNLGNSSRTQLSFTQRVWLKKERSFYFIAEVVAMGRVTFASPKAGAAAEGSVINEFMRAGMPAGT